MDANTSLLKWDPMILNEQYFLVNRINLLLTKKMREMNAGGTKLDRKIHVSFPIIFIVDKLFFVIVRLSQLKFPRWHDLSVVDYCHLEIL